VLYQLSYIPTRRDGDLEDCTCRAGHLSKQMSRVSRSAGLALAFIVALGAAAPVYGAAPVRIAANRCNSQTVDDAYGRVRDYDRHGPGGSSAQLLARYGAIADVIAVVNEEREILDSICSSQPQRAALFAEVAATAAWALALESDVVARLNTSCPAAAKALPTVVLADAWLSLARVVNDGGGSVPRVFADVIPRVQARAQALGLPLPAWNNTSAYWRDQVKKQAEAAIATCPSPSPTPS
jgi:hypothetical protein